MADKFERDTQQWVGAEPQITLPSPETLKAIAVEELNDRASRLREITRVRGQDAGLSVLIEEAAAVVDPPPTDIPVEESARDT